MNQNTLKIYLNSDKSLISRDETTQRILEIRVQAPVSSQKGHRPKLNLALVLDRSGSMAGEKLEYVKQAASYVIDQLQDQDHVAVVIFDDEIQMLAHSTMMSHGNRHELKRQLAQIRHGGSTNLGDGWLTGSKEIALSAQEGTLNRTMLLTDGLANVGETNLEVLAKHAFELYKDSISTSTFGVGLGFNEHLLEAMSNKGGGNFHYISSPDKIPEILLKEFNDILGITARKVEIRLDLPKTIEWQILGGWPTEYQEGKLHIYLGDMLSGKTQDIYLKFQIPAGSKSSEFPLNARAFGQDEYGKILDAESAITYQYADQIAVEAAQLDQEIMQRFALVELADEASEALRLERMGRREEAQRRLNDSLTRNSPHVSTPTLDRYQGMSNRIKTGMDEADRKQSHFDIYKQKREKEGEEK